MVQGDVSAAVKFTKVDVANWSVFTVDMPDIVGGMYVCVDVLFAGAHGMCGFGLVMYTDASEMFGLQFCLSADAHVWIRLTGDINFVLDPEFGHGDFGVWA